jgi:ferredoxin-NADP reductase
MAEERRARLVRVVDHAPDVRSLVLALDRPLGFVPGQFVSCLLPVGDRRITRAYTIASSPERGDELELLLDRVPGGPGSGWLFARAVGDEIAFTGPWGAFVRGIAPIRPMLHRAARDATRPLRLLYATTQPVYRDELAALPAVQVEVVPPDGVEDAVAARFVLADGDRTRRFWICGVGPVVHRLRDLVRGAGYERRAVRYEKW